MAIKIVDSLFSKLPKQVAISKATQAYLTDQLLMEDTTNGYAVPATSSASTLNVLGVGTKAYTEGSSNATVNFIPVITGAVFVVADTTAATAANQLHKNHLLTDGQTINNTSSTNTSLNGVFHALAMVGATSNKKLYGYFIRSGQVTV